MMKYAIELNDVAKDYGDFKLDKISFSVPEGCICGFIGQNGAGKTTTLRTFLTAKRIRTFGARSSPRGIRPTVNK